MAKGILKIATCQFAVSESIERNAENIQKFIRQGAQGGADIIHFSEGALSGYACQEFVSFEGFGWDKLKKHTEDIMLLAKEYRVWVVLGSSHRLTEPNKPYNCLYLIDEQGKIRDRYDKRFLTEQDLEHYSAGDHFVTFEINGVKCGLLICFDLRFPEIYRQIYKLGVNVLLQSFYNARQSGPSVHTQIMRQTMQCRAATNNFWVSMTNSSGYYSPYPSCFIRPDGKILQQLKANKSGMMINAVDMSMKFYDPMANFRDLAIKGCLNNGKTVKNDKRAKQRDII